MIPRLDLSKAEQFANLPNPYAYLDEGKADKPQSKEIKIEQKDGQSVLNHYSSRESNS